MCLKAGSLSESRLKARKRELVRPQCPLEVVFPYLIDDLLFSGYYPCLRPSEELIAAEGDEVGSIFKAFPDSRLPWQPVDGKVYKRTAAEAFHDGYGMPPRDRGGV